MVTQKAERPAENGMGQDRRSGFLRSFGSGMAQLCVIQRGFEIATAAMEDRDHAEHRHLIHDIAACLGKRQASVQGSPCHVALALHVHR